MMVLITGGSSSGKSALAESLGVEMAAGRFCGTARGLTYLATMDAGDDPENRIRIQRHQKQRSGLGFVTVECPVHLSGLEERQDSAWIDGRVVLLECLSNLLANEMYADFLAGSTAAAGHSEPKETAGPEDPAVAVERIEEGLLWLESRASHLIIVSNEIFSNAQIFDAATRDYIEALGRLNRFLAARCDCAIESFYGLYLLQHDRTGKAGDWLCSNGLTAS